MKVSFAILAWNEAGTIRKTIESISHQSIIVSPADSIDSVVIAVVVNGSTDGTSSIAQSAFEEFFPSDNRKVSFSIFELPEPNRAAAWNAFVHKFSETDCDLIGFMDADIELKSDKTLENLILALWRQDHAYVAGAKSVKHIESKKNKSLKDRLSLLGTSMEKKARLPFLAGQLYLGRASFWRRFYVPYGMCADDSLFTVLAWTSFQREPIDPKRVIECDDSEYVFEAYMTLRDLYRQHRRRNIGGVMHHLIWDYSKTVAAPGEDVGDVMTREFQKNPYWLVEKIQEQVKKKGIMTMRWSTLKLRFTQLRYQPAYKRVFLLPVSFLFAGWAFIVLIGAYRTLKKGSLRSLWAKPNASASVSQQAAT